MIEGMPPSVLTDYVELRLRLRTGVLFGVKRAAEKMGWGERRMYQCIAAQKHWGLMYKDEFGHYVQVKSKNARKLYQGELKKGGGDHSHKTTLKLNPTSTRQKIADLLKFKLAEARKDQFLWARRAALDTSHCLRSKKIRKGFNESNIWVRPEDHPVDPSMLELSAGEVSMTMKELAKATMQSERTAYRWKKRMGSFLLQENREVVLEPLLSRSLDANRELIPRLRERWKGSLVRKRSGWVLVLPNTYRLKPTYKRAVKAEVKQVTKYQLVLQKLAEHTVLQSRYAERAEAEAPWYAEAFCNH